MMSAVTERYSPYLGLTFGSLTLVRIEGRGDRNRVLGVFKCACGGEVSRPVARIIKKQVGNLHCGCRTDHGTHRRHGMRYSPEYTTWKAMKRRCLAPEDKDYPRYGGRGIRVFDGWVNSFDEFYAHVGPRPQGTTLDRKDVNGDYAPGNVRWATASEQQRNRRDSRSWIVRGKPFATMDEAAEHFEVSKHTVWRWLNGQFDKRRGTYTPPREDCYAV